MVQVKRRLVVAYEETMTVWDGGKSSGQNLYLLPAPERCRGCSSNTLPVVQGKEMRQYEKRRGVSERRQVDAYC